MPTRHRWRSRCGSWLVVAAPLVVAGGTRQEPDLAVELEALIERTNALSSLRATYRGEAPAGAIELELAYQAPDRALLTLTSPEGGFRWWFVGGVSVLSFPDGRWWHVEAPEPPPLYRKLLAWTGGARLEPGVVLEASAGDALAPGGVGLRLDYRSEGREAVFAWLHALRARGPGELRREGDLLLCQATGLPAAFARTSGLPATVELAAGAAGNPPRILRLVGFDTGLALDPATFELPAEGLAAERDAAQEARVREERFGTASTRSFAYRRLGQALREGHLEWNERTQAEWEGVLAALLTECAGPAWRAWVADLREEVDQLSTWSHEADPDSLRATIAARRAERVRAIDADVEATLSELPALEDADPRLLACERTVVARLVDELVRRPALAYFDDHLSRPVPRPGDRR